MARIRQSLDLIATLAVSLAVGTLGMLNLTDGPIVSGAILVTLGSSPPARCTPITGSTSC